ncbi:MAG: IS701 family transposase [Deltaproteobacteria bacterium]|jgi:SRSO17 transposase|nr:IS701 family transposase [Deltaproteobacteria bacterium]
MKWEEYYKKIPLEGELAEFEQSVRLHKVDETLQEGLWDHVVQNYHYLGYDSMFGCRVKYLISLGKSLVGAISFCSAIYRLGPRDMYVGWDEKTRQEYLPHILNNNRFLIFPWIKVRNLASHVLALSLKRVREDWTRQHGVEPYMVETFVENKRFSGTSYVAAGWTYLGVTKGFAKIGKDFVYHGNEKDIYVKVMNRRFYKMFKPDVSRLPNEKEELLNIIKAFPVDYPKILKKMGLKGLEQEKIQPLFAEHIARYTPYLGRKEHSKHFAAFITGLMSDLERKTAKAVAITYDGEGEARNMMNFMTSSILEDCGMLNEYQSEVSEIVFRNDLMITGDECDFPKKGKHSVGVYRQYSERLGKLNNCQLSVMTGISSLQSSALYDFSLFMPEEWFSDDYRKLRDDCRVPEDLRFVEKNQLLLNMIERALNSGKFNVKYVGLNSTFGKDLEFLDSLPTGLIYFAEVPDKHQVFLPHQDKLASKERGKKSAKTQSLEARMVKDIVEDSTTEWKRVALETRAKVVSKEKIIKVLEMRDGIPGKDIWLYSRMSKDGTVKYYLCNAPINSKPEMIRTPALLRWNIEEDLREEREHLGMNHYETRSWSGWRRHMLYTSIAHLFIKKLLP